MLLELVAVGAAELDAGGLAAQHRRMDLDGDGPVDLGCGERARVTIRGMMRGRIGAVAYPDSRLC